MPARDFRAWLATEIQLKGYTTAETVGKRPRDADMAPQNAPTTKRRAVETARGAAERKVRRWVHEQTAGCKGEPHLTPPMVAAAIHNLGTNGTTAREVLAAIVSVAAETQLTVTWRVQGRGGASKDGMKEVREVFQQWGMSATEVTRVTRMAKAKVRDHEDGTLVGLDYGEGWGGMKEGMSRVMTVYGIDTKRHLMGQHIGTTVPDIRADLTKGAGDLMQRTLARAKVAQKEHPYAHFSVSCTEESINQRLEKAKGAGSGQHAGKRRSKQQTRAVREVVEGVKAHREREPRWAYTVEQPRGSAMAEMATVKKHLGQPVEVRMCCYGYKHCKPTWLWTNLYPRYWQPRPFKKGQCTHCNACNTGTIHPERMTRRDKNDKRPPAGTSTMPGYSRDARWNRVAPELAEELAQAALTRWHEA